MRKGILEFCILQLLSKEPLYTTDIILQLKSSKLIIVEGTLYPLLSRLKNEGLLSYYWEESKYGPPRKYFSITDNGFEYLANLSNSWDELVEIVKNIKNK